MKAQEGLHYSLGQNFEIHRYVEDVEEEHYEPVEESKQEKTHKAAPAEEKPKRSAEEVTGKEKQAPPKPDDVNLLDLDDFSGSPSGVTTDQTRESPPKTTPVYNGSDNLLDLDFGGSGSTSQTQTKPPQTTSDYGDILFFDNNPQPSAQGPVVVPYEVFLFCENFVVIELGCFE